MSALARQGVAARTARVNSAFPAQRVKRVNNISKRFLAVRATSDDVDLEDEVEKFMRKQAELESGAAFIGIDKNKVLGAETVSEEAAQKMCANIFDALDMLKKTRDMSFNEVKLIVSIEDPRAREKRAMGIEDERGVSRDEMAAALVEVSEGRIPNDRIALKCLHDEMLAWPYVDISDEAKQRVETSAYSNYDGTGTAKPIVMSKEDRIAAGDKPSLLPDWVGYGALYGISAVPVLIAVTVVLVIFFSSLK